MYKNANERRAKMNRFDIDKKMLYKGGVGQESNINSEKTMEKEISDIFSKHYSRMINDLSQIVGFTPVMKVVISNSMRCLEDDILEIKGENYGLDKNTN